MQMTIGLSLRGRRNLRRNGNLRLSKVKKHSNLKPLVKDDFVTVFNKIGVSTGDDSLEMSATFVDLEDRKTKRGDNVMHNCSVCSKESQPNSGSGQMEIGQSQGEEEGVPHSHSSVTSIVPSISPNKNSGRVEEVVGGRKKSKKVVK